MKNETIYKLLTSPLNTDVYLGYEYFTHKFKKEILENKNDREYYLSVFRVRKLLGIEEVNFAISWDFKNESLL